MAKQLPSIELLQKLFSFDPQTGAIKRKLKTCGPCRNAGSDATWGSGDGYLVVSCESQQWLAHRVAWKLHYGSEPPALIDHKNRNRSDNKIDNLRSSNDSNNQANSFRYGKHRGVSWDKERNKWFAKVTHNGKQYALGRYNDLETALGIVRAKQEELWGSHCAHLSA